MSDKAINNSSDMRMVAEASEYHHPIGNEQSKEMYFKYMHNSSTLYYIKFNGWSARISEN